MSCFVGQDHLPVAGPAMIDPLWFPGPLQGLVSGLFDHTCTGNLMLRLFLRDAILSRCKLRSRRRKSQNNQHVIVRILVIECRDMDPMRIMSGCPICERRGQRVLRAAPAPPLLSAGTVLNGGVAT